MSAGLKVGTRRLDLAKRTALEMGFVAYGGEWNPDFTLEGVCAAARPPPLLPDEVKRRLEHEKTFTSQVDVGVVDKLYRGFFDSAARFATRLDFHGSAWGSQEVQQLVGVLPSFVALTALDLSENHLGAADAQEILGAGSANVNSVLSSWSLAFNQMFSDAAAEKNQKPSVATGIKAIAAALQGSSGLTTCTLIKNALDVESATMLAKVGSEKCIMLSGMRRDQTEANFKGQGLKPADAILIASDLPLMAGMTVCNLLKNNLGAEAAKMLAKVGTEKRIMLSGIKHDQTEANFRGQSLKPADGILIASDIRISAVLTSVNILANEFDRETAEMFLKVKKDKDKDRYVYKKECSALTTLCGIKPGQTEASFEGWGLRAHDALLLADELAGSSVLKTDCALPVDSVLTSLDLHCNDIGSAGALAIAEALKSGRSVLTNLE